MLNVGVRVGLLHTARLAAPGADDQVGITRHLRQGFARG